MNTYEMMYVRCGIFGLDSLLGAEKEREGREIRHTVNQRAG
jgi:hypothetical protein